MDFLSFFFLFLIIIITFLFLRFLFQIYKDRGRLRSLSLMPGDEALDEMHGHGEFELPEYFQYGDSLESQPHNNDSFDAYNEYGIYEKFPMSIHENPLSTDPRSMIDPRYYKSKNTSIQRQQSVEVDRRRTQFKQPPQSRLDTGGAERRLEAERRGSFDPCLNCEMIRMGSATTFGDNTCPSCGKQWTIGEI